MIPCAGYQADLRRRSVWQDEQDSRRGLVYLVREGAPTQDSLFAAISHADLLHIDVLTKAATVLKRLDKGMVLRFDCCALHIQLALRLQQCGRWALGVALQLLPPLLLEPGLMQGPEQRCSRISQYQTLPCILLLLIKHGRRDLSRCDS